MLAAKASGGASGADKPAPPPSPLAEVRRTRGPAAQFVHDVGEAVGTWANDRRVEWLGSVVQAEKRVARAFDLRPPLVLGNGTMDVTYGTRPRLGKLGRWGAVSPLERLYREGVGAEVSGRLAEARRYYAEVVAKRPGSYQGAQALGRLSAVADTDEDAWGALEQLRKTFPSTTPAVLQEQLYILRRKAGEQAWDGTPTERAKSSKESVAAWEAEILSDYPSSESASELRWERAMAAAKAGSLEEAAELAGQTSRLAGESVFAAGATFYMGKWKLMLGSSGPGRKALRRVLKEYPNSYYAWRSAALLHQVEDPRAAASSAPSGMWAKRGKASEDAELQRFMAASNFAYELRQVDPAKSPQVSPAAAVAAEFHGGNTGEGHSTGWGQRLDAPLPVGSLKLRWLYGMGKYEEARRHWEKELGHGQDMSAGEIVTDSLLRIATGDVSYALRQLKVLHQQVQSPAEFRLMSCLRKSHSFQRAIYPLELSGVWGRVEYWSRRNKIDPLLPMSIIRQESGFDHTLTSEAGARGVMQIMPETAAWVAETLGVYNYNMATLDDNVRLGTWYLNFSVNDLWKGNPLLGVAMYNAGGAPVENWVRQKVESERKATEQLARRARELNKGRPVRSSTPLSTFEDWDDFIESIDYPETRFYAKHVMANYYNYHRLWGAWKDDV